ncbi:MAG: hypothetical protein KAS32_31525 [Candidatus Peribacteraceae bacterium]|nr:hypothetical protein [Candidatus Peribacteraceae bacterium]
MTSNRISYKDIAKLIHPDCNPSITDAGSKMDKINVYRENDEMLYKFGVKWGVIIPEPTPKHIPDHRVQDQPVYRVGDLVFIITKRCVVTITGLSRARVYFNFGGKPTYALKTSIGVIPR